MGLLGEILDGKYAIKRLIAAGGMAEVYLGVNERIGRSVAVKVLYREMSSNPSLVARFEREARIAARIRSAHIPDILDSGELPTGERYIVMEYLEGESLAARLAREKTIAEPALATIAIQILDALVAAHAAGIVHRDLKPENVLLTTRDKNELVKLVDFGVSKIASGGDKAAQRTTMSGIVLGTPMYMSPEQARGLNDALDHRTDLYALGVILYEAVSGATPFVADNVTDLLVRVASEEPASLEQHAPNVSRELLAIIRTAMAKTASERYADAEAMREAVLEWQASMGLDLRSSIAGLGRTTSRPAPPNAPRRFSARSWLLAPTLVALGAGVTAAIIHRAPPPPAERIIIERTVTASEPVVTAPPATTTCTVATESVAPKPPPAPAPRPKPAPVKREAKEAERDAEAPLPSSASLAADAAAPEAPVDESPLAL